ncbi:MAG: exo-alpha-sialidase [Candidatus Hydrogenedentes bacterium]|nr:exo-alpha-sialidase [Candidatus Hydrogenedentota bacterium]
MGFCANAAEDFVHNKVIGTEYPGKYKHPAAITQLDNGDLYITYYGGDGEYEDNSAVMGMRLKPGETKWSEPVKIADTPFQGEGNGVVWQAPDGLVWLFYVQRYGDTWSSARIFAKISEDGAHTWSDSMVLSFEMGTMLRGLPIVLNNGEYLLPVYYETGHDREVIAPESASYFLRHDPKTRKWTPTERIYSDMGNIQPEPVQIDDNYLIAYCRVGGDYEPSTTRYLIRAESRDGGNTWSRGVNSPFKNPNAAVSFIKLKNGHLLLVFNDSMIDRIPLNAAISTDNDKTWSKIVTIGEGEETYAYPMAIQTQDEKIHVVYTSDNRSRIMHCVFEESALLK